MQKSALKSALTESRTDRSDRQPGLNHKLLRTGSEGSIRSSHLVKQPHLDGTSSGETLIQVSDQAEDDCDVVTRKMSATRSLVFVRSVRKKSGTVKSGTVKGAGLNRLILQTVVQNPRYYVVLSNFAKSQAKRVVPLVDFLHTVSLFKDSYDGMADLYTIRKIYERFFQVDSPLFTPHTLATVQAQLSRPGPAVFDEAVNQAMLLVLESGCIEQFRQSDQYGAVSLSISHAVASPPARGGKGTPAAPDPSNPAVGSIESVFPKEWHNSPRCWKEGGTNKRATRLLLGSRPTEPGLDAKPPLLVKVRLPSVTLDLVLDTITNMDMVVWEAKLAICTRLFAHLHTGFFPADVPFDELLPHRMRLSAVEGGEECGDFESVAGLEVSTLHCSVREEGGRKSKAGGVHDRKLWRPAQEWSFTPDAHGCCIVGLPCTLRLFCAFFAGTGVAVDTATQLPGLQVQAFQTSTPSSLSGTENVKRVELKCSVERNMVTFVPSTMGLVCLSIKLDNIHIYNSPFSFQAAEITEDNCEQYAALKEWHYPLADFMRHRCCSLPFLQEGLFRGPWMKLAVHLLCTPNFLVHAPLVEVFQAVVVNIRSRRGMAEWGAFQLLTALVQANLHTLNAHMARFVASTLAVLPARDFLCLLDGHAALLHELMDVGGSPLSALLLHMLCVHGPRLGTQHLGSAISLAMEKIAARQSHSITALALQFLGQVNWSRATLCLPYLSGEDIALIASLACPSPTNNVHAPALALMLQWCDVDSPEYNLVLTPLLDVLKRCIRCALAQAGELPDLWAASLGGVEYAPAGVASSLRSAILLLCHILDFEGPADIDTASWSESTPALLQLLQCNDLSIALPACFQLKAFRSLPDIQANATAIASSIPYVLSNLHAASELQLDPKWVKFCVQAVTPEIVRALWRWASGHKRDSILVRPSLITLCNLCRHSSASYDMVMATLADVTKAFVALVLDEAIKGRLQVHKAINMRDIKFGNIMVRTLAGHVSHGTYCGEKVAVKVFKMDHIGFEPRDLMQEIAVMSFVRHPHINPCIGASLVPGSMLMVSPFCEHLSLENLLYPDSPSALSLHQFSVPFRTRLALEIAEGIFYLHSLGIMHRDVKPGNCLLDSNYSIKLIDFGSSKIIRRRQSDAGQFTQGVGTPIYMAPEVLDGSDYTELADVFSFGVLLFELHDLQRPFAGVSMANLLSRFYDQQERPAVGRDCPYQDLLAACWSHNPKVRPLFGTIVDVLGGCPMEK